MEVPSIYTGWEMDEVLDDLSARFVINLPQEELVSTERVCFQIEEAYWYYDDFVRENSDKLKRIHLNTFLAKIFERNPMLSKWGMHQKAYQDFMEYKRGVPVRGGILMNENMDKVILVKGFKASNWAFPRGKINKDEADHICAIREVLEETGFDSSDLIDPSHFLVDMEDKGLKHLQLYLIRNVPEDFNFHPLARKEISDIAWFSLADLRAYAKREAARDPAEELPGPKFKQFKVYSFLPGISRWIKNQRKLDRQQARNQRKAGGVYETEPESSAVEFSPPKPQHRMNISQAPAVNPAPQMTTFAPPGASATKLDENAISMASAKLREMIGIMPMPANERPPENHIDRANAGHTLLAQLQASATTPTAPPSGRPNVGVSIPVSNLLNQMSPPNQNIQTPTGRAPPAPIFMSPPSNFSPSQAPHQNYPPNVSRPGQAIPGQFQHHNTQYQQSPKQNVTILQRGQPLPNNGPTMQPQILSPATPKQVSRQPSDVPTQSNMGAEEPTSSPMKMARRPLLTIDAFTPPAPAKPPTSEHKGNLLQILMGAKPPPPPHPAMQLQRTPDGVTAPSPVDFPKPGDNLMPGTQQLGPNALLAQIQGLKLGSNAGSIGVQETQPLPVAPPISHATKHTPSPTMMIPDTAENIVPSRSPLAENLPTQNLKSQPSLGSPITPKPNDLAAPSAASPPATIKPSKDTGSGSKSSSFDRRGTVKPEQAQMLLGLLKSQPDESSPNPTSPQTTNIPQNNTNSKNVPSKDKTVAPEMSRTSSLRADQTAFLMNFLDNLATQHGF